MKIALSCVIVTLLSTAATAYPVMTVHSFKDPATNADYDTCTYNSVNDAFYCVKYTAPR